MAWYLAPSLAVLRAEVNARWPNRDKTSDGTIGDTAHQSSTSDHNPNSRESVDAWDMDKDGVDPDVVIAAFQKHPSAHYWIFQQQIADADDGWRRRPYTGSNPHDKHVHFSIRQSAAAEGDTRSWGLEDTMDAAQEKKLDAILARLTAIEQMAPTLTTTWAANPTGVEQVKIVQHLRALATAARVDALAAAEATRDAELRAVLAQHSDGSLTAEAVVQRIGDLLSGS